jgi:signal transduction histidine kinase
LARPDRPRADHRSLLLLAFSVHDTGRGFDPRVTARGAGLTGIRDRIETVGGRVEIVAAPGRGTTVAGAVPWPPRAA